MKSPRAWLEGALGVTSATVLFLMMMITAVDVIGRYVFNKPLAGGFEITEMLLAALIFVTYGYQFAKFGSIQSSEISGLPMLSIYIAWPIAGLTWVAFLGEKFREDVRILRGEIPPPKHEIPKAE